MQLDSLLQNLEHFDNFINLIIWEPEDSKYFNHSLNIIILNEFYDIYLFLKLTAMAQSLTQDIYISSDVHFTFLFLCLLKKKKCICFSADEDKYGMEC